MSEQQEKSGPKTAGAFDIRLIIAMLIGAYGLILIVMGLFATSDADVAQAADVNINLWGGVGMVVVAAAFVIWVRLRPIIVEGPDDEPSSSH